MPYQQILIIRFSAMGDVMLLVPVLRSFSAAYPDVSVTLVTRPRFASFFAGIPGLKVFEADVDYQYNGFLGLRDLFRSLMRKADYDLVIDMHDHIRTMMLRSFFKLFGKKVIVFKKGRSEKKKFTKKHHPVTHALKHTVQRYHDAFRAAGYDFPIVPPPYIAPSAESVEKVDQWLHDQRVAKQEKWIGVAPFAMHYTKIWPTENYEPMIEQLLKKGPVRFFFFGGGEKEIQFFNRLKERFPDQCVIVAGQLKIKDEIALLRDIDLMLCVDSSNMHLAALTATPLLSIWGGTHPDLGFGPYRYDEHSIMQIDTTTLPCRPCSVYGKEKCYRGDFACMTRITSAHVANTIAQRLGL